MKETQHIRLPKDPVLAAEVKKSPEYRTQEYRKAIQQVLLHDWDPIGVSHIPGAHDEYEGYDRKVLYYLKAGRPNADIIEYLLHIETDWMGDPTGNYRRARAVAKKLKKIKY